MDKYTATELAFKNGYEKGYNAAMALIVRCVDCKGRGTFDENGIALCWDHERYVADHDFCSNGEREVKPNISTQTMDAINKMGNKAHGGNNG